MSHGSHGKIILVAALKIKAKMTFISIKISFPNPPQKGGRKDYSSIRYIKEPRERTMLIPRNQSLVVLPTLAFWAIAVLGST